MASLKAIVLSVPTVIAAMVSNGCPPTTSTAPVLTAAEAEPPSCDYTYCDEHGSKWCYLWGGVTAYDWSKGVIPAETRVPLGPCHDGK